MRKLILLEKISEFKYLGCALDEGECAEERWIDTVKDCLKKRGLDVRQARRIVHDKSVWREFVRWNAWGVVRRMNP